MRGSRVRERVRKPGKSQPAGVVALLQMQGGPVSEGAKHLMSEYYLLSVSI